MIFMRCVHTAASKKEKNKKKSRRRQLVYVYVYVNDDNDNDNVYVDIYANAMQCRKWMNQCQPETQSMSKAEENKQK